MESDPEDRTVLQTGDPALLYGATWAMSAASIALGSAVLLGWATGSQRLVQLASGCPSMKPAAATCFILLGTALAGRVTRPWPARADLIAATAAGAVVVLALLEYATGRDVGVDRFPFTARVAGGGQSGRVALATGLEILLLVTAVAAHAMGRRRITQALCLLSLTGSLVAILGFVYGARHLYSINAGSAMALNTAIGLAGVAIGLLSAVPDGAVPRLVRDTTPGAVILRRLLPVVLVVLPLIGWLCQQGQRRGLFGTEFALAVMVIGAASVLTVTIWRAAVVLERSDACLRRAMRELAQAHASLDQRVRERTADLAASEDRFRALLEAAPDAMVMVDEGGVIQLANRQTREIFGYDGAELVGSSVELLLPEAFRDFHGEYRATHAGNARTRSMGRGVSLNALCKDGREIPVEIRLSPAQTHRGLLVTAAIRDVTEAKLREVALRESEERFRLAFDDALIGMALASLEPPNLGRLLRVNLALCRFLGYSEPELLELNFQQLGHPDETAASKVAAQGLASGRLTSWRTEKRYRHAAGHYVWGQLSTVAITNEAGKPAYAVSQIADITAQKAAEADLTRQALHDGLTGLPNRHLMHDHLTQALARAKRNGTQVGVIFLDLDHFKSVNDSLGHTAGDELLVEVGRRLVGVLRGSDTAARLGGDEFVVVCEDLTDADELPAVANRLLNALDAEVQIQGHSVGLSGSIGLALSGPDSSAEKLLRDADAAMYRAKQRGRSRWEMADEELQAAAVRQIEVESGLRHALAGGQLLLHYQPTIDLETERVVGVEALLRWRHPHKGLLLPRDFLDIAEDRQLIVPIGSWVLRQACAQATYWRDQFGADAPSVAVNISSRQVGRNDLTTRVREAIEASELAPSDLCLEITERQMIDLAGSTSQDLHGLADLGVRLAVDDFGTGYAGLAYLRKLPVSAVKIDRSLISGLDRDNRTDTAITRSVVALGQTLGICVIAEGVETRRQRDILRGLECPTGQGWLWHPALPPDGINGLLAKLSGVRVAAAHSSVDAG